MVAAWAVADAIRQRPAADNERRAYFPILLNILRFLLTNRAEVMDAGRADRVVFAIQRYVGCALLNL
ncbi:hypothetical protein CKO_01072 [Citrobacter koseri ATCC BAA-895]|uniref:Uncharacterized protein n=1 Tax=Citrobacter koseri (strain ATCC BAA-895 / CDC 4225-83 / SGSC4696) TaxID=290338 RepID=A8AFF3_CITK8|nr:hypothetical protein CKO_01072 [Citrobacter koseri ATCC BAA-895]